MCCCCVLLRGYADSPLLLRLLKHELTTDDIKACASDLKVLGKKDFRHLLKWRTAMRLHLGLDAPAAKASEVVEVTEGAGDGESVDSDAEIDEELERLNEERVRKLRKERRRRNEARAKRVQKLQLSMTTPMDIGTDLTDETLMGGAEDVFDLTNNMAPPGQANHDADASESSDDDDEDADAEEERRLDKLEGDLDAAYDDYRTRMSERDAKWRAKEARRLDENREAWHGFSAQSNRRDGEGEEESEGESSEGGYDVVAKRKLKEETFDTDDEEDEADDAEDRAAAKAVRFAAAAAANGKRGVKRKAVRQEESSDDDDDGAEDIDTSALVTSLESKGERSARQSREAAIWFDNPLFKGVPGLAIPEDDDDEDEDSDQSSDEEDASDDEDEESEDDEEEEEEDSDVEHVPRNVADEDVDGLDGEWRYDDEDLDEIKRRRIEGEH